MPCPVDSQTPPPSSSQPSEVNGAVNSRRRPSGAKSKVAETSTEETEHLSLDNEKATEDDSADGKDIEEKEDGGRVDTNLKMCDSYVTPANLTKESTLATPTLLLFQNYNVKICRFCKNVTLSSA